MNSRSFIGESMTFYDLFRLSDPKRVMRSKSVTGPPLDIRAFDDATYHIFNFKSSPSTTGLRHHGYIKFKRPRRDTPLSRVNCVVDCGCPDYRYRWAHANKQHGASQVGPKSVNKAWNKAPRITNPQGKPGLCKHILALKDYIQGIMYDMPKTGLKSTDDVLSRLVKWSNDRWANMPAHMAKAKERDARFAAVRAALRAGQDPTSNEFPPIPGEEELAAGADDGGIGVWPPSTTEEPQDTTSTTQAGTPASTPMGLSGTDDAEHQKPPELPPGLKKRGSKTVLRKAESNNMNMQGTFQLINELIDQETEPQMTAGESEGASALELLRSIDTGLKSLASNLEQLLSAEEEEEGQEGEGEGEGEGDQDPGADLDIPELDGNLEPEAQVNDLISKT